MGNMWEEWKILNNYRRFLEINCHTGGMMYILKSGLLYAIYQKIG